MTTPILILVRNNSSLADLAKFVAATLGVSLDELHQENVGRSYSGDIFDGCGVDIFDKHGFEDDQGIPFSEYELAVDISVRGKWEYGTGKEEAVEIVLRLSKAIANHFQTQCLVVDNLQVVIATVEPDDV